MILDKILALNTQKKAKSQMGGSCTGAALKCGSLLLEDNGGKLLLFMINPPTAGLNTVKIRNNLQLYNTEKEITLLKPDGNSFNAFGELCLKHKIAIDLFACPQNDIDLASLAAPVSVTGGQLFHYPFFNANV